MCHDNETDIYSFIVVALIQSVTTRNEYVAGVFYRTDSGLVEVPSNIPAEATEVYLQDNKITELKTWAFSHLTECTKLDIHNNSITTIEGDAFSGIQQLGYLYLYHNKIKILQKSMFSGLNSLTTLDIHSNFIETIQDGCFSDLSNLFLPANKLSGISGNMWLGLSALKYLHLHWNEIPIIKPGDFDNLPKLKILFLFDNPLTTLSHTMFSPSVYPETDGHPRRIQMALGLMKCNSSLCWLKQGEQRGWITWYDDTNKIYQPDCISHPDLWTDVDLSCPKNGLYMDHIIIFGSFRVTVVVDWWFCPKNFCRWWGSKRDVCCSVSLHGVIVLFTGGGDT